MTGEEPPKQLEVASITERLNNLYADEDSALAPEVAELGFEALRNAEYGNTATSSPAPADD